MKTSVRYKRASLTSSNKTVTVTVIATPTMKDNANPVIHSISVSKHKERKPLIAFQQWQALESQGRILHALELSNGNKNEPSSNHNHHHHHAKEHTIHVHSTSGSQPNNLRLLLQAGLKLPSSSKYDSSGPSIALVRPPSFVPWSQTRQFKLQFQCQQQEQQQQSSSLCVITKENPIQDKGELVDADEIFDLIRNIQDPEHPLTLEQLNVVHRDHVVVQDHANHGDDSTMLSSVQVRFT